MVDACRFWHRKRFACCKVLATRKPALLFWLSGWLLLRFDERTLAALLLNDPPRNTRLLGLRPLESQFTKYSTPKLVGVRLHCMT